MIWLHCEVNKVCNINIIIRKDRKKTPDITNCMNVISALSYYHKNNDGDGYFAEDLKVKTSEDKLIYKGDHHFIVAHQRLSTSGKVPEMTQPLESKNFIFAHNGVFSNTKEESKKESDSWYYLQQIEEEYANNNKNTVQAIKTVNERTSGSYSCVIYNKKTDEFYYYKESASSMFILETEKYRLMSTKEQNVEYMKTFFGLKKEVKSMPELRIIDLWQNKQLVYVDTFTKYVEPVRSSYYNRKGFSTADNWLDRFGQQTKFGNHIPNDSKRLPGRVSGGRIHNPLSDIEPQEMADYLKTALFDYWSITSKIGIAVDKINGREEYVLKISVDPNDYTRVKWVFYDECKLLKMNYRKAIVTTTLSSAYEHMVSWETASQHKRINLGNEVSGLDEVAEGIRELMGD